MRAYFPVIICLAAVSIFYCSDIFFSEPLEVTDTVKRSRMEGRLSAFVFGASGTIGGGILRSLARDPQYTKVTLFGRRKLELPAEGEENYSKFDQRVIDFDKLDQLDSSTFKEFNIGFYALGISQTKVDEATYRVIEGEYPLRIGKLVKEAGVPNFNFISGRGAGKDSWFLFGKVKAAVEEELEKMDFPRLTIIRPGAVISNTGSSVGLCLTKALDSGHRLAIDANTLGNIIISNAATESDKKFQILEMKDIARIEKELGVKTNF